MDESIVKRHFEKHFGWVHDGSEIDDGIFHLVREFGKNVCQSVYEKEKENGLISIKGIFFEIFSGKSQYIKTVAIDGLYLIGLSKNLYLSLREIFHFSINDLVKFGFDMFPSNYIDHLNESQQDYENSARSALEENLLFISIQYLVLHELFHIKGNHFSIQKRLNNELENAKEGGVEKIRNRILSIELEADRQAIIGLLDIAVNHNLTTCLDFLENGSPHLNVYKRMYNDIATIALWCAISTCLSFGTAEKDFIAKVNDKSRHPSHLVRQINIAYELSRIEFFSINKSLHELTAMNSAMQTIAIVYKILCEKMNEKFEDCVSKEQFYDTFKQVEDLRIISKEMLTSEADSVGVELLSIYQLLFGKNFND